MRAGDAILVVGPSWVGDMVMAQALFKTLKNDHPATPIDVLAPPWSLPLLARMGEIRQGIPMPLGHGRFGFFTRIGLGRGLKGRYGQAIVLPNSWKSALTPLAAAIPQRTGFLGELRWGLLNDIRTLDKDNLPRPVDRFVALGRPEGADPPDPMPIPALNASAAAGEALLARLGFPLDQAPLLALAPGAEYGPAKRWPPNHFAALAQSRARTAGWRIVLLGSAKEYPLCEEIRTRSGCDDQTLRNLAGRVSLEEAVDILAASRAVVTNDSGLMHVAAALDRPGVALFGSSDPGHTPPLGGRLTILSLGMACAPCFKRVCPKGHTACLADITPDRVEELL